MTIRFLIDAQLPPDLALHLTKAGIESIHVGSLDLLRASDAVIWRKAAELDAVIVTKDEDFVTLAKRSDTGTQVVWVRFGNSRNAQLWLRLSRMLDDVLSALKAGERIVEVI